MLKFNDIYTAFEYVSSGDYGEHEAYLNPKKDKVIMIFDPMVTGKKSEAIPDEEFVAGDWIAIPNKRDLNLGSKLVFRFAKEALPQNDWAEVDRIFSKRGAYSRWKVFLNSRNLLQNWYDYSNHAEIQALKEWLNWEKIPYEAETGTP